MSIELEQIGVAQAQPTAKDRFNGFPWWLVAIFGILGSMVYLIIYSPDYRESFDFLRQGLTITITTTLISFIFALGIGLIAGLGRISDNTVIRNVATLYVEFVRGVPILVLMFTVAFVIVPPLVNAISQPFIGMGMIARPLTVDMSTRAIVALALIYGAYIAEVFRAGIESIAKGQMEAARSLGLTQWQGMRYVVLPQAIRNVLPALGNDFIAMLKDSSLVSVLAVRDITQQARLLSNTTFKFQENFFVLTFLYLTMTIALSLLLQQLQRRLQQDGER